MKKELLTLAIGAFACVLPIAAQDSDFLNLEGSHIQSITSVHPQIGVNVSIVSMEFDRYMIMGNQAVEMTRAADADTYDGGLLTNENKAYEAFTGTYSGEINIPVSDNSVHNRFAYIGYGAFSNCTNITKASIPYTMLEIRRGAFNGCISMTDFSTNSNRNTGNTVAQGRSIYYPDVFRGCTAFKKADISGGIHVMNGIFQDCPALEEVHMFATGNMEQAFLGRTTPSLKKLILYVSDYITTRSISAEGLFFPEELATAQLIVPSNLEAEFRAHPLWGQFANISTHSQTSTMETENPRSWSLHTIGNGVFRVEGEYSAGAVYNEAGIMIAGISASEPQIQLPSAGIYIVCIDGHSEKLVMLR